MPYLYTAFVEASQTAAPIQRPLIYDYQYDSAVRELDDQYLLGGSLLVAPILEQDSRARGVYLPAGEWFDWHTGRAISSDGKTVRVDAPLDQIPLFAKSGSVIPMWTEIPASTADYYPAEIELRVFVPSTDGSYVSWLQEDDGITLGALTGSHVRTEITVTRTGDRLTVAGTASGAGFAEFARERFRIVLIGAFAKQGTEVVLENAGNDFELEFDLQG